MKASTVFNNVQLLHRCEALPATILSLHLQLLLRYLSSVKSSIDSLEVQVDLMHVPKTCASPPCWSRVVLHLIAFLTKLACHKVNLLYSIPPFLSKELQTTRVCEVRTPPCRRTAPFSQPPRLPHRKSTCPAPPKIYIEAKQATLKLVVFFSFSVHWYLLSGVPLIIELCIFYSYSIVVQ